MRYAFGLALLIGAAVAVAAPALASEPMPFDIVYRVLESPRCMNCHPKGDAPLQFDDHRAHAMNITRRSEQNGLSCATCHRAKNGTRPNQPPGAPNWHLPPAQMPMVFEGKSPAELCAQLKDPARTGGRDLAALIEHVANDPLVAWGWDPGPGRTPVPVPRADFVRAMKAWVVAGAPCPE